MSSLQVNATDIPRSHRSESSRDRISSQITTTRSLRFTVGLYRIFYYTPLLPEVAGILDWACTSTWLVFDFWFGARENFNRLLTSIRNLFEIRPIKIQGTIPTKHRYDSSNQESGFEFKTSTPPSTSLKSVLSSTFA